MDESVSGLLEAVRAENISKGTAQTSLKRLVEAIVEEQAALRKNCENLSQENQELRTSIQQLPKSDTALYI